MTAIPAHEQAAIRADAECRLDALQEAAARLLKGQDDPQILSELVAIAGAIRQTKRVLEEMAA